MQGLREKINGKWHKSLRCPFFYICGERDRYPKCEYPYYLMCDKYISYRQ